jgi:diguanylate cyclase (GGDEF)-like protein
MNPPPLQHNPQVIRRFTRFAYDAGVLIIVVAMAALLGWWLGIPSLTSVVPGQQSMKATTAIGFVLAGMSLLASLRSGRRSHVFHRCLSLTVVLLGAANLVQYIWQVDLGIDHLFHDAYAIRHGMPPGRMTQITAVAFLLLGGMGLLIASGRWLWLRELLAVALLAIATWSLAVYGFALVEEVPASYNPLAIQTALLLLLATLGWMSSVPTTGLTRVAVADTIGGTFARRLLLPALLLPVAFTFTLKAMQSLLGVPEVFALSLAALFTGGSMAWMVWWVATLLDRVERQRRESELLRDDANTDPLTQLANRRAFDAVLARLLRGRRENDAVFSLLMLDLDNFKAYNDAFGHQAGDKILRNTGQLLHAVLRPSDLAARYGGEEFALLLPGLDAAHARKVAERILANFRSFPWLQRPVTVSIGVTEAHHDDGVLDLVHRADAALYEAKRAGRDQAILAQKTGAGELSMPSD